MYDKKKILKEIKSLNIPKEYFALDLQIYEDFDYYMIISIRGGAKTTQCLLLALAEFKHFGNTFVYMRCDEKQLTRGNLETLFDVILEFDYISKMFNGEYNSIEYKPQTKRFYLCQRDADGEIAKKCERPFLICLSLENWKKYKSSLNLPNSNTIIFDEIYDSDRQTNTQMVELQNNISTVFRERAREGVNQTVIMLGNNINVYSFWHEEFCIEDDIKNLNFGGYIANKTPLGTSLYCTMWDVSEKKKKDIFLNKIRFSGFNTPKMNAFNGLGAWSGLAHPHIPEEEMLKPEFLLYDRLYIFHRNRFVKIKVYQNEDGIYCFLHYATKPMLDDNIILTSHPTKMNEIYGIGRFAPDVIRGKLSEIINLRLQNRWYFATNSVGDLVEDYFNEIR